MPVRCPAYLSELDAHDFNSVAVSAPPEAFRLSVPCAIIITLDKLRRISMAAPQRNQLWDVQRLFYLAAKRESPTTCPMARIPADELAVLGGMISDFLRVPPDMHLHPPATMACKVCFTPVCKTCEENGVRCLWCERLAVSALAAQQHVQEHWYRTCEKKCMNV